MNQQNNKWTIQTTPKVVKACKMRLIRVMASFLIVSSMAIHTSAWGSVRINEILANNAALQEIDGSTPDWVELYNDAAQEVDLTGWSFNGLLQQRWIFPSPTKIPAQGYLVIFFSSNLPASARQTGFGLSTDGDTLSLRDASQNLVDTLTFGMQIPDLSIGRLGAQATWSLNQPTQGAANVAKQLGNRSALVINEWMADPISGDDWFELYNPETNPVDLSGLFLTDDLTKPTLSKTPALCFLGVGENAFQRFYASGDTNDGPNHVGFKLSAGGESIGLFASASSKIQSVAFGSQLTGISEGRLPDAAANVTRFPLSSSPGKSNFLPLNSVWINEIISHTDDPLEDAIELHNPGNQPVSIGNWFLSDDASNFMKYRIPAGTSVPAHGFVVFYQYQFNGPDATVPFSLDSAEGDSVFLSSVDASGKLTGYRAVAQFGPLPNAVSVGRFATSVGVDYPMLQQHTFGMDNPGSLAEFRQGTGSTNAALAIGPVVITEIMYHPPSLTTGVDNTQEEYVELCNVSAQEVPLFDTDYPTNLWRIRGGISFQFPKMSLRPGQVVLIVAFDVEDDAALAAFRIKYQVPQATVVLGPFQGKLGNAEDEIRLEKPDPVQGQGQANMGLIPFVIVEGIYYSDTAPWPPQADGAGYSLQRLAIGSYCNEPLNWQALAPKPGRVDGLPNGDTDQDGIPDTWETAYGLNPQDPSDAAQDLDQDGLSNLQEYICGTLPNSAVSVLKLELAQFEAGGVQLQFSPAVDKSYTVEYTESLPVTGSWLILTNIAARSQTAPITVLDAAPSANSRWYRLLTPKP
jgi:hypothetical protein